MFKRQVKLPKSHSFFLFGARATGKSTLLKSHFGSGAVYYDLLEYGNEDKFARNPDRLLEEVLALGTTESKWIIIDEIQKNSKLLDIVHKAVESTPHLFALTGSSARKLRRGSANMLAGRAFVLGLFPLTYSELGPEFRLADVLNWGSLPGLYSLSEDSDKVRYLQTYARSYLSEEVWNEHLIRKLEPFRKFLEVAAQSNGKIVNYSNIARDVGVDYQTVKSYYQILSDTLIGFFVEPFHQSVRKSQRKSPKFYFFDIGVVRALDRTITQRIEPASYGFGRLFEHLVVLELYRMNSYLEKDLRFLLFPNL